MAVMTLLSFRAQLHIGHLDHIKQAYGYLYKIKDVKIYVSTDEPAYSKLREEKYDWAKTVYGDVTEIIPKDEQVANNLGTIIPWLTAIPSKMLNTPMAYKWSVIKPSKLWWLP